MASSTPTSAPVKKPFLSSPKLDAFANACPPFRFLLHLINNPGNSEAHEKQKWLMSCLTARHDANLKGIVYTRINDQLATASLVNTFIAGFSVVIINKKLDFEYDMVPREVIVGLLGLSFCLSICTVLIAVTIKQHLAEVGSDFLPTYFYDYPWTLSMLSHFATNAVGTFLISGICIYFNRFSLWVSGCTRAPTMAHGLSWIRPLSGVLSHYSSAEQVAEREWQKEWEKEWQKEWQKEWDAMEERRWSLLEEILAEDMPSEDDGVAARKEAPRRRKVRPSRGFEAPLCMQPSLAAMANTPGDTSRKKQRRDDRAQLAVEAQSAKESATPARLMILQAREEVSAQRLDFEKKKLQVEMDQMRLGFLRARLADAGPEEAQEYRAEIWAIMDRYKFSPS